MWARCGLKVGSIKQDKEPQFEWVIGKGVGSSGWRVAAEVTVAVQLFVELARCVLIQLLASPYLANGSRKSIGSDGKQFQIRDGPTSSRLTSKCDIKEHPELAVSVGSCNPLH